MFNEIISRKSEKERKDKFMDKLLKEDFFLVQSRNYDADKQSKGNVKKFERKKSA
jgi:hypothetical protein